MLTTDAKVATADAASVDFASAVLGGTLTDATADATCGVVISTSSDVEAVRAGLIVKSEELKDSYSFVHEGWCPKRNTIMRLTSIWVAALCMVR